MNILTPNIISTCSCVVLQLTECLFRFDALNLVIYMYSTKPRDICAFTENDMRTTVIFLHEALPIFTVTHDHCRGSTSWLSSRKCSSDIRVSTYVFLNVDEKFDLKIINNSSVLIITITSAVRNPSSSCYVSKNEQ